MKTKRMTLWTVGMVVLAGIAVIMILPFTAHATPGDIVTIAGDGVQRYAGDNGPATSASLGGPTDVAVDASGNVYIADFAGHRIRKINAADGTISTIAGNGTAGYSGDGGPATAASLSASFGIALDARNNVFFSDYMNHRVRKVDALDGTITTVAGNGTAASYGDNGPAVSAGVASPCGLAFDAAGDLYIAETAFLIGGIGRIRKVNMSDGSISTVAGGGTNMGTNIPAMTASMYPTGVSLDVQGNIYIADVVHSRIIKVSVADGILTTVAGTGILGYFGDGGPAVNAQLRNPYMVFVDRNSEIYFGDTLNQRIRKVDLDGNISTVAGNGILGYSGDGGSPLSARLQYPHRALLDPAGNLYIADYLNYRVRKVIETIKPTGSITVHNNSGYANSLNTTLNLSCTDQGGTCAEMQFSNDGTNYSAPQPYSTTVFWTLEPVAGSGTVYAIYKDAAGNWSDPVSAAYVIDATPPAVSASPAGGSYTSGQIVTLSCDDGAGSGCDKILYTTDGTVPTPASAVYSGPIAVSASMTITFLGTDKAGNTGNAVSAGYTITLPTNGNGNGNGSKNGNGEETRCEKRHHGDGHHYGWRNNRHDEDEDCDHNKEKKLKKEKEKGKNARK